MNFIGVTLVHEELFATILILQIEHSSLLKELHGSLGLQFSEEMIHNQVTSSSLLPVIEWAAEI